MAGGKETPRQKMIGMMYLVLTALLALNVSKQVIAAFITLNDKLDASTEIIDTKVESNYSGFDQKRAALGATDGSTKDLDFWQDKATMLKSETALVVSYLLGECNAMIEEAEGTSWVQDEKEIVTPDGGTETVITKLKPLDGIAAYDNYDIPTNMFIGGNPDNPDQRGLDIRLKILEYRNKVCELMGTYTLGGKKYSFVAPENEDQLEKALLNCNPKDTAKIKQLYTSLSLPEELHAHEQGKLPWSSVMFDHAPIVAAAAMFTSLKLDIKNAEANASEYMLAKVEAPMFDFDTIEPLAFASSSYMNSGDSMNLKVKVAAYNSHEISQIKYGIDADTSNPANWKVTEGDIPLYANSPGSHKVKGQIGVRERGEIVWKDFVYDYNVGQPMGVVALPEMRVLYWGYENIVEGAASGFDPNMVSLTGQGCRLTSTGGGKFIAKVENGTRNATISVTGRKADGSTTSLGKFNFVCKPFPEAQVYIAGKKSGEQVSYTAVRNTNKISVAINPSSPITTAKYTITGGDVFVSGLPGIGAINPGGTLDAQSKTLMGQSRGKTLVIEVRYKGPDGVGRIATYTGKVR